jgi:hypothetical protein
VEDSCPGVAQMKRISSHSNKQKKGKEERERERNNCV